MEWPLSVQPSGLPAVSKSALCVADDGQAAALGEGWQKHPDADANSFILVVIGIWGQTGRRRVASSSRSTPKGPAQWQLRRRL